MAQFASDDFAGSSGTGLSTYNADWVEHTSYSTGNLVISNAGRVRRNATTNNSCYYYNASPAGTDYSVTATLFAKQTSGGISYTGVCGRLSSAANTMYHARYGGDTVDGWQLFKFVAGSATQLGSTVTQELTDETGYEIKLEMVGTSPGAIKLYKEGSGTPTISVTDSDVTGAGYSGIRIIGGTAETDTVGLHLDDFSADDISAGVTGTGAGTTAATTASGSGTVTHKGTGTLSTAVVTSSGAGNLTHKVTGSLSLAPITASGAGKLTHVGTGALTIQPVTVDGAGTVSTTGAVTGSGSLTIAKVTANGAGTIGHIAVGTLDIGPITALGSGVIGHTGTGDLTTSNPIVDGYDSVREPQVRVGVGGYKQGKYKSSKKQKVILIERVEDVEDLVEQIEEVVREEPKVKPLLRKAKKQKPETVENTTDNAQAWIDYYQAIASALQDQEKARQVEEALQRGVVMLNAMMERQETAKLMAVVKRRKDEEDFLLMLMAA